jgi:hypothetical protein
LRAMQTFQSLRLFFLQLRISYSCVSASRPISEAMDRSPIGSSESWASLVSVVYGPVPFN